MAHLSLGTTAVAIPAGGRGVYVIQNLGPGVVYLDVDADATTTAGIRIGVNELYEFPTIVADESLYSLISDQVGTDVRYMVIGNN